MESLSRRLFHVGDTPCPQPSGQFHLTHYPINRLEPRHYQRVVVLPRDSPKRGILMCLRVGVEMCLYCRIEVHIGRLLVKQGPKFVINKKTITFCKL